MPHPLRFSSRRAVRAALIVSGVAALCLVRPSRGQQPTVAQPDVQVTLPATASPGRTRIDYALTLPTGLQIVAWPAVRVVDQSGQLVEYAGMTILQRAPQLTGFHRLWTKAYPPGTYHVTVELGFNRPDGAAATFATPAAILTVP